MRTGLPAGPPLESSLRALIVRLARANPHWGYRRIVGELKGSGITVSATSVQKVLLEEGLQPAPERSHSSWRVFLRAGGKARNLIMQLGDEHPFPVPRTRP